MQKLTRLLGKRALWDPGCAVFRLRHLGLHPGGRRDVPPAAGGRVLHLPTQKERVHTQSGPGAGPAVAGAPAETLRLPSGHERLHAERMPPTGHRLAGLRLHGPVPVTVLLGGGAPGVVGRFPRIHDSLGHLTVQREVEAAPSSSASGCAAVRLDAGV